MRDGFLHTIIVRQHGCGTRTQYSEVIIVSGTGLFALQLFIPLAE